MDVRKLLKVYNYVNNDKRPKVNLKFAGALVAFVAAGALLVAFLASNAHNEAADPLSGPQQGLDCPSQTEYVGLDPAQPGSLSTSQARADDAFDAWKASHPGWTVEKKEPVNVGPAVIGYRVTAQPTSC